MPCCPPGHSTCSVPTSAPRSERQLATLTRSCLPFGAPTRVSEAGSGGCSISRSRWPSGTPRVGDGVRHIHASFADSASDVALLVVRFGGEPWSWSLAIHGPVEFENLRTQSDWQRKSIRLASRSRSAISAGAS